MKDIEWRVCNSWECKLDKKDLKNWWWTRKEIGKSFWEIKRNIQLLTFAPEGNFKNNVSLLIDQATAVHEQSENLKCHFFVKMQKKNLDYPCDFVQCNNQTFRRLNKFNSLKN